LATKAGRPGKSDPLAKEFEALKGVPKPGDPTIHETSGPSAASGGDD
jgi:hypothetical protein